MTGRNDRKSMLFPARRTPQTCRPAGARNQLHVAFSINISRLWRSETFGVCHQNWLHTTCLPVILCGTE